MDKLSSQARSNLMSRVKNANTKPEIIVRRLLHKMGYRFRLHNKKLPGSPDIVLPRHQKVIFIHGCFWHSHDCSRGKRPTTRVEFWNDKLDANKNRDNNAYASLHDLGWQVLIIWECWLKDLDKVSGVLSDFLNPVNG